MGLPIRRLVLATNENDGLDRFFRTGRHAPEARARATSSPSMDIAIASNFERFLFDLVGRDPAACRRLVEAGAFDLAATPWHDKLAGFGFVSGRSTHADRIRTIRRAWTDWGVELDPHSADAVGVAGRHRQKGETLLCLETALPAKFEAVMTEALGRKPARPAGFDGIEDRPQHVTKMPPDLGRLEDFIATHDRG
jgi:threonine synthase